MAIDAGTLGAVVLGLAIAVAALLGWVFTLQRAQSRLRQRLRGLFAGQSDGLDEVLDRTLRRVEDLGSRVDALNALQREIAALTQRSIQRIGLVRFNPFPDSGGDQSFAIALLDADGTGMVLSSLHSRTDTRVFAKQVSAGRSKHQLSDEEQEAIRQALTPAH